MSELDFCLKNNVILLCVTGSKARGLDVTETHVQFGYSNKVSDTDYQGVYVNLPKSDWRLEASPDNIKTDGDDGILFEVRKYIGLLLKGSPEQFEPLYSSSVVYVSSYGANLRLLKHDLMSKRVTKRLIDGAGRSDEHKHSLLGRALRLQHEDPAESRKAIVDVIRRLLIAKSLLHSNGEVFPIFFADFWQSVLMKFKFGLTLESNWGEDIIDTDKSFQQALDMRNDLFKDCVRLETDTALQETPNLAIAQDYLYSIYEAHK